MSVRIEHKGGVVVVSVPRPQTRFAIVRTSRGYARDVKGDYRISTLCLERRMQYANPASSRANLEDGIRELPKANDLDTFGVSVVRYQVEPQRRERSLVEDAAPFQVEHREINMMKLAATHPSLPVD